MKLLLELKIENIYKVKDFTDTDFNIGQSFDSLFLCECRTKK